MNTLSLWTRRDPFAEFDALFRTAFLPAQVPTGAQQVHSGARKVRRAGFVPAAEILRDGDDALVRLELPGLDVAKDVEVEVDRGHLVVRGERRDERSDDAHGVREVRYGSFHRTFTLPQHVLDDAVSATYDAGVLTVKVAGAYARQEPRRIAVTGATPDVETAETPAA